MNKLIALLLVCFSLNASATQAKPRPIEECAVHVTYGFPTVKKTLQPICRKGYISYFDTRASIPALVAYVLRPEHAVGCLARESFEADESVGRIPNTKDYAKSGYDIGHMANAADMAWDPVVSDQAGFMTNMTPQLPGFNRGVWKKLEDGTRGWAISRQTPLQVYVASVYDRKKDPMIGKNFVTVPHGFVKVLIDTKTGETQIFMFKHEASKANLNTFITSLAEIQKRTGVQFPMPKDPTFSTTLWPVELKSARAAKAGACAVK